VLHIRVGYPHSGNCIPPPYPYDAAGRKYWKAGRTHKLKDSTRGLNLSIEHLGAVLKSFTHFADLR
jgi:hypothetical protein